MKIWKSIIRIWFTLVSLASFLFGWAILAHAPKPNQFNPADVPSLPKLDPVPSLNDVMVSDQSLNIVSPGRNVMAPVLRTGGS